jgi:hypothetical protein
MFVDSAALPFLDAPARNTLDNLPGSTRVPLVDLDDDGIFATCAAPRCTNADLSGGTLAFDVTGFTTYSSAPEAVDFSDLSTSGIIVQLGGLALTFVDEPDPDGVGISAIGGSGVAKVRVCGGSAVLTIRANTDLVVTCTSVSLEVEPESEAVDMDIMFNGVLATVTVSAENAVTFEPETDTLTVITDATDTDPVTLKIGGAVIPLALGEITRLNVDIDIKPGSDPNCFNINGHGVIPVAILGSDIFDASDIDQGSFSFGGLAVRVKGNAEPQCGFEDTNGDGFTDLVCHFEDDASNWNASNGTATLGARLLDGTVISGTDSICVVP